MSRSLRIPFRNPLAGLLHLGLGAAAIGLGARCSKVPDPVLPPNDPSHEVTDPVAMLTQGATDPAAALTRHPELSFKEFSEGLPTSGTWLGYPLLYDFNHDGRADLVASNREEDGYNAWMSPAHGAWVRCIDGLSGPDGKPLEGLPRDMGYGPAVAGDVDSDGIPDLVLSAHSDALRVYLNDGSMHWTRTNSLIENSYLLLDVALGNIDGDANLDIAGIGHFKGGISVFLGNGKGGFRRLPESSTILQDKAFGRDIELVDIDGDGHDDIIATTNEGLKVYLTKPGTPLTWQDISSGLPAPKIGNSLYAVCAGHFTGGKAFEIATCLLPDPAQKVAERDTIGVYAFDEAAHAWHHIDKGLVRSEAYRDVKAGDFNGDGKLDLLVMSLESGALIYLGDGAGGFQAKGCLPGVQGKGRAALGDVDGDGKLDIAIATPATKQQPEGGSVRVFLNRPEIW